MNEEIMTYSEETEEGQGKRKKPEEVPVKETKPSQYHQLMKRAGCERYAMRRGVYIKDDPGVKFKQVFAGLNGSDFYFKMDTVADMPEPVYQVLKQAGRVSGGVLEEPEEENPEQTEKPKAQTKQTKSA